MAFWVGSEGLGLVGGVMSLPGVGGDAGLLGVCIVKVETGEPGVVVRWYGWMLRALAKRPAGLRTCLQAAWTAKSMARRLFLMAKDEFWLGWNSIVYIDGPLVTLVDPVQACSCALFRCVAVGHD
jgi:hypothetical protein